MSPTANVVWQKLHWLRVRLQSGYFSRMRLVSWTDKDGNVNFVPIIEPRPPARFGRTSSSRT